MKRFRQVPDVVEIACGSASTSYRSILPPGTLRRALRYCNVDPDYRAHIQTLLEEGSPGLLRRMVRQIAREQALPEITVWINIKRLADALHSDRPCSAFPLSKKPSQ